MANRVEVVTTEISQRKISIIAGAALLAMAVVAGFAYGHVFTSLFVPGDAAATAVNIRSSEKLFRLATLGFVVVLLLDVLVAWALYIFLKPAGRSLSLLTAWMRLIYSALLGGAVLNLVAVLVLVGGAGRGTSSGGLDLQIYLQLMGRTQVDAQIFLFLNMFLKSWSMGLIVFGCHLFSLGYTVFKSGFVPKIFGILLMIASLCYLANDTANLLVPNYETIKASVEIYLMGPMIVGELGFGLWLLFKGGKKSGLVIAG